ncbi:hypothetical protein [Pontibacter ruber]|nr:hypothetical protein [Pontibacter ruber]
MKLILPSIARTELPSLDYREREFEGSERSSEGRGGWVTEKV